MGIDLVFVLDGSSSIGKRRYQLQREFAETVASVLTIGPQDSLVGAIVFSSSAFIQFNLQQLTNATTLLPALNPGLLYRSMENNTAQALRQLLSSTEDGTMGIRDGRTHIAIVVTDDDRRSSDARNAASTLHAAGIYQVYATGFGVGDVDELNDIASDPSLVSFTTTFDTTEDVIELTNNFTQTICLSFLLRTSYINKLFNIN